MSDVYAIFFALPGARVFFLGIWALVIVTMFPFAWGWDDFGIPGDPSTWQGGAPKFEGAFIVLSLSFPLWPLMAMVLPFVVVGLIVIFGVPYYLSKWWNADWSRPVEAKKP